LGDFKGLDRIKGALVYRPHHLIGDNRLA